MVNLKVKRGILALPEELRVAWRDAEIRVREYPDRIALEGPASARRRINLSQWKKAAGMLRGRRMPDPLRWQRKIRKEWERSLS